jgi:hypothetical protein
MRTRARIVACRHAPGAPALRPTEHVPERSRDPVEFARLDQERAVTDLAPRAGAEKAAQPRGLRPVPLRGLRLQSSIRVEFALSLEDAQDGGHAASADQLVFEIGIANEEAKRFRRSAIADRCQHGALQRRSTRRGCPGLTPSHRSRVRRAPALRTPRSIRRHGSAGSAGSDRSPPTWMLLRESQSRRPLPWLP